MKSVKSSFYPLSDLKNKSNYKPYFRIQRDGTIYDRILLDIPDPSIREKVICLHYLRNEVLAFKRDKLEFDILSRDDPWDFKIKTVNSETFNIEITSIADDKILFEKMKREERLALKNFKENIPLHDLIKLNAFFPRADIESRILEYMRLNVSKSDLVQNPYYDLGSRIILSNRNYIKITLESLIQVAIEKKELKKHSDKEKTVLIIDNRSLAYEYQDFHSAREALKLWINSTSFLEIWFYTGYYSDLDGNNSEYSLAPLKIPENKLELIAARVKVTPPDKNGIIYF
jgi:hypothetical protein